MEIIRDILAVDDVHGMNDLEINDRYEVDPGDDSGYMPLTMEKVRDDVLAVDQHYIQRMDYMQDPGVRFRVLDYDTGMEKGGWLPIEYRQDGFPQVHQRDEQGLGEDVRSFIKQWDENLRSQGFYEMAKDGRLEFNEG